MDTITGLQSIYRREWLAEYTPYRMGTALGRFDKEYQSWLRFQEKLQEFSEGTKEGATLPPLSSLAISPHFSPRFWKGGASQAAEKLPPAYNHPGARRATPPESGGELLITHPSSDEEGWRAERRVVLTVLAPSATEFFRSL